MGLVSQFGREVWSRRLRRLERARRQRGCPECEGIDNQPAIKSVFWFDADYDDKAGLYGVSLAAVS